MEVGGSEHYPDGELGVIYFRKPGMDEKWQKLTDIAAARVSLKDEYTCTRCMHMICTCCS